MRGLLPTYRKLAALMAVALLGHGVWPVLAHYCGMANDQSAMAMSACCCEEEANMDMMDHAMPMEMPCQESEPADTGLVATDCCTQHLIERAYQAVQPKIRVLKPILATLLQAASPRLADPVQTHGPPLVDTGPPPSPPIALHLLHASYLI